MRRKYRVISALSAAINDLITQDQPPNYLDISMWHGPGGGFCLDFDSVEYTTDLVCFSDLAAFPEERLRELWRAAGHEEDEDMVFCKRCGEDVALEDLARDFAQYHPFCDRCAAREADEIARDEAADAKIQEWKEERHAR